MKEILFNLFKKFVLPFVVKKLETEEVKNFIVERISSRVDLKSKTEEEEKVFIKELLDASFA